MLSSHRCLDHHHHHHQRHFLLVSWSRRKLEQIMVQFSPAVALSLFVQNTPHLIPAPFHLPIPQHPPSL